MTQNVCEDESAFGGRIQRVAIPQKYFDREPLKALGFLVLNLSAVLGAGPVAYFLDTWWGYAIAFILVGARAEALYILQHECMHSLLFRTRSQNDTAGLVLSGLLGTRLFEGRRIHFQHHREVGRATDPNQIWHGTVGRGPGWPALRFFLGQLFGGRALSILKQLLLAFRRQSHQDAGSASASLTRRQMLLDVTFLAGMQATILLVISLISAPWVYFALYLAPLLTLTSFFEAFRSFSEHVLPGDHPTSEPERNRLYFMDASRVELFFISAFHFNYHHIHHLYPGVVTFKLPELHSWLRDNDPHYDEKFIRRSSYVGTALRYVLNSPIAGAGIDYPKTRAA